MWSKFKYRFSRDFTTEQKQELDLLLTSSTSLGSDQDKEEGEIEGELPKLVMSIHVSPFHSPLSPDDGFISNSSSTCLLYTSDAADE